MPTEIAQNSTRNIDALGIVLRMDKIVKELIGNQSHGLSAFHPDDFKRSMSYLSELESFVDHCNRRPHQDYPKSNDVTIALPEPTVVPLMDNLAVLHLAQMVDTWRFEIANSETSRRGSGIHEGDYERMVKFFSNFRLFMIEHVSKEMPMDYPETVPSYPLTERGALGV